MRSDFTQSKGVRTLTARLTQADTAQTELFTLPAGCRILGIFGDVEDAFNAGATLKVGTSGDDDKLITAMALQATGHIVGTLANSFKTTAPTVITATVSDGTAVGIVDLTVMFAFDLDTRL
jgi:hypothetical protein